jgi:alpha-amylase/alpha-mannosidase (GH57 family)
MKKITWVNFLHIYQPPWQTVGVVQQIASQSYEYLVYLFKKYPQYKATINISGCLLDMLFELRPDLIKDLQILVKRGQIELTGSSQFHAILPLLSQEEIIRQIKLNEVTLNKYFPRYKARGFYLPEMAYSPELAKIVKKFGYQWIILDPICTSEKIDSQIAYSIKNIGLQVVFRDREISKKYPAEEIFNKLGKLINNETIISATDGEIYGHRHEDWQGHVEKVIVSPEVEIKTVSRYLASLKSKTTITLRAASWESTEQEVKSGMPFSLWADPKNKIHQDLWALLKLAGHLIKKYPKDSGFQWARMHLDQASTSCTFWWASARQPSDFSPLTWHPDMIDNGAEELVRSVRSLERATIHEKMQAEKLYLNIKKNTWVTHWKKYSK